MTVADLNKGDQMNPHDRTLAIAAADAAARANTNPMITTPMTLSPLEDRVVVKLDEAAGKVGSLYVPDIAKDRPQFGVILALGPGRQLEDGTFIPIADLKIGQRVVVAKYAGFEVELEKETFVVTRASEILAIVRANA
jgi:chaperonin GroES